MQSVVLRSRVRHHANAKRDLPGLVSEVVEPLTNARDGQQAGLQRLPFDPLSSEQADHAIMEMYRNSVINLQRIGDVEREWTHPSFEELEESGPTAWCCL
jgi:hypothetical protein